MSSVIKSPAKRVFIFDNARNRSHLFYRLLSTHPNFKTHYHPYVNAGTLGPEKIHRQIFKISPERQKLVDELWEPWCSDAYTFAEAERGLVQAFAEIEKGGKVPLCNEHCAYIMKPQIHIDYINTRKFEWGNTDVLPANPTHLPDDFWNSITPIMVIRHPALAIPSLYRATAGIPALANLNPNENQNFWLATLGWSRMLFEKLRSQGRTPVVVDGEDVCTRTDEVVKGVCDYLGFDASGVSDKWKPLGKPLLESHPVFVAMTETIWASDGVKKHEAEVIYIDKAVKSIEAEYGAEVGAQMRVVIEGEMDNYRFLEQFKV